MLGLDVCEFGGQVLELLWLTMCYRGLLSDKKNLCIGEEEDDRNLNYVAPAQRSLEEIQRLDQEDESLVKYKQTLLGNTATMMADPNAANVQVTRLTLLCDKAGEPITMDLTGDLTALKEKTFTLKEGTVFKLKIHFKVNREIVAGLRYHHVLSRKDITMDKVTHMVGSYGPKPEEQEFICPADEAPKGMMARGHYQVKSRLIDDDKNVCLKWEWNFDLKKDWDE